MTLAEKLVSLREKYGMDGAQTAQELGVAPERLAAWEDGSVTPGPSGLMSIADVFDVELEWLLDEGRSGEPEPRRARYSRFCSISGWVLFALFCIYDVLSVFVTLADNAPGALILLISPLMRALASAPEWLLLPGALLGLAHRRSPRRA